MINCTSRTRRLWFSRLSRVDQVFAEERACSSTTTQETKPVTMISTSAPGFKQIWDERAAHTEDSWF